MVDRPVKVVVKKRSISVRVGTQGPPGPIGPPGPPGPPDAFIHYQTTPSDVWIINHNLGYYPDVTVLSPGLAEVDAEVVHISTNQVRVYFVVPFAGIARCI